MKMEQKPLMSLVNPSEKAMPVWSAGRMAGLISLLAGPNKIVISTHLRCDLIWIPHVHITSCSKNAYWVWRSECHVNVDWLLIIVNNSMSLHLGDEIFDVHTMPIQGDFNHLFVRQGTGLQGQSIFKTKLAFR